MTPEQQQDVQDALLAYWTSRDEAAVRQAQRGAIDVGGRAGVTAGGHLDRVTQLFARQCIAAGAPPNQVHYNAPKDDLLKRKGSAIDYTLPGYYRPTKQWDLVVYHDAVPIVVMEFKSQNGPSYGNNANNRAEEAIGNAVDLARARQVGLIPGNPWTGYVFVLEDDAESRKPRGQHDRGAFPKDGIFTDWSYADRVRLLCQRLVVDRLYDAAWAVATSRPKCPGVKDPGKCPQLKSGAAEHRHEFGWSELDPVRLGYAGFTEGLTTQITKHYPEGPGIGELSVALFD